MPGNVPGRYASPPLPREINVKTASQSATLPIPRNRRKPPSRPKKTPAKLRPNRRKLKTWKKSMKLIFKLLVCACVFIVVRSLWSAQLPSPVVASLLGVPFSLGSCVATLTAFYVARKVK